MQNFSQSKNMLSYAYLLTPSGVVEKSNLMTKFLKRKVAEYEALWTASGFIDTLKAEMNPSKGSPQ